MFSQRFPERLQTLSKQKSLFDNKNIDKHSIAYLINTNQMRLKIF